MGQALCEIIEAWHMERLLGHESISAVASGEKKTCILSAGAFLCSEVASEIPDSAHFSWMLHKVFPPPLSTSEDVFLSQNR